MKEKVFIFNKIGLQKATHYNISSYFVMKSGFVSVISSTPYFYVSNIMPLENVAFIAFYITHP